jgi:DNA-directed RNA polymerase beta subunit
MDEKSGKYVPLFPKHCFENKTLSYFGEMFIDLSIKFQKIKVTGEETDSTEASVKDYKLCTFPVMVKSCLCNLSGLTPEEQFINGFDPNDKGGYFIVNGSEWQITLQESVKYNGLRIMNKYAPPRDATVRHSKIKTVIITKFGDGYGLTYSVDTHITSEDEIYVGINDPHNQGKESKLWFPFYVIMYMLGAKSDEEIVDYIMFNVEN